MQSLSSNHPFRRVILVEASVQLKRYSGVQVDQVFDPVFLHTIRLWAFPVRHFFYLLPYFLKFQSVRHHVLLFSTLLNQSVFSLCVTACPICHSKNVYSPLHPVSHFLFVFFQFVEQFWVDSNKAILLVLPCPMVIWSQQLSFCFTLNFLSSFDMRPSFWNSLRLILFNCPDSLCNAFCLFKKIFRQLHCLFPLISFFL